MAFLRRNGLVTGLAIGLAVLLVLTRAIQPDYGVSDFGSLARAALPYAFATAAQVIVVIGGGIDLSIAATMALVSVSAAVMMQNGGEHSLVAVILALCIGVVAGAVNGILIVLTRIPDIIVTLAMLFVLQGAALLVLPSPGGGAAQWLKDLVVGVPHVPGLPPETFAFLPNALILIVLGVAIIWIPLRKSRLGLSIYAIGSNERAAFRSGVRVRMAKIASYALGGLFAALGGLSLTASTGVGAPIPGPYLLASVAAVVLGGVALAGGRGGIVGPLLAVFVLRLVRTDLTLMAVDPNVTTIIEGSIMVLVVMIGAFLAMRANPK